METAVKNPFLEKSTYTAEILLICTLFSFTAILFKSTNVNEMTVK